MSMMELIGKAANPADERMRAKLKIANSKQELRYSGASCCSAAMRIWHSLSQLMHLQVSVTERVRLTGHILGQLAQICNVFWKLTPQTCAGAC